MSNNNHSEDFQEPKQINIISLLRQRDHIKILIDNRLHAQAFQEMCSLVCEFDLTSKDKDMLEIKKALLNNYTQPTKSTITSFEDMEYFDLINTYMNATYFKGFKAPMSEDIFKELEGGKSDDTETES
jgi:hypothetical protein